MKFWLGLGIGIVVGLAAMYLGLERPWSAAAPPAVAIADDAGVAEPTPGKRKPKRKPRRGGGGGGEAGGDGDGTEPEVPEVVLTAADRRLEWRGDDVVMPARTVDLAGSDDSRSLDQGEIQRTVERDGQAVLDCIGRAAGGARLEATITLKLLVDGSGKVTRSRVQAPAYLFAHGLLPCARRAAAAMDFAATGAPTVVTAPFELY